MILEPLANRCLAFPCALALDPKHPVLYVCETLRNRVLKFYLGVKHSQVFTVFHQFAGRLGPSAIATSKDELICVARYEFAGRLTRCVA